MIRLKLSFIIYIAYIHTYTDTTSVALWVYTIVNNKYAVVKLYGSHVTIPVLSSSVIQCCD